MTALLGMLAFGVAVPALTATAIVASVLMGGRRLEGTMRSGVAVTLGLGLGELAGHAGVSWPSWPPSDVTDRIPYLVLAAMLAALVEVIGSAAAWGKAGIAWGNRTLLTVVTLAAMLGPIYGETWTTPNMLLGGALIGAGMVLAWANLDAVTSRVSGPPVFLPLLLLLTGASVVLVLSGSVVLGRLAGVLTAAFAGCWVVSWWTPIIDFKRGGRPILVVALGSLLLNGHFYAEVPRGSVVLLAMAPATLALLNLGPVARRPSWVHALIATTVMAVPVAVAVGLAVAAMPSYEY